MSRFYYEAIDPQGRRVPGVLDADGEARALAVLDEKGLTTVSLSLRPPASGTSSKTRLGRGSPGAAERASFAQQMGRLMESGCPMDRALELVAGSVVTESMFRAVDALRIAVQQGTALHDALAQHPRIFSQLFMASVKAGEAGGFLAKAFARLAEFELEQDRLQRKIVQSMIYPAFMILSLLCSLVVIFVFVVPNLLSFFEKSNMALPAPTRLLIAISSNFGLIAGVAALLAGGLWALRRQYGLTPAALMAQDRLLLRLPILGRLVEQVMLGRFCRTMTLLLEGGVSLTKSLEITAEAVTSRPYQLELRLIAGQVTAGESFSRCLEVSPLFPAVVAGQVRFGEETGSLPKVLASLAGEFERNSEGTLEAVVGLVEPMMIVAMGLVMGFVVISLFMPLVQMVNIK
jgi:type II secretory pathway component PulF